MGKSTNENNEKLLSISSANTNNIFQFVKVKEKVVVYSALLARAIPLTFHKNRIWQGLATDGTHNSWIEREAQVLLTTCPRVVFS